MAHVLNATLRLSQRASTRKVSHVLSGSTRSLSSTSSPAARACAARNASFLTAFSNSRSSQVLPSVRAFSTKPEEVDERAESVLGGIRETVEQAATEQPQQSNESWRPRRGNIETRVLAPSKTFYVGGLPFFATEEDVRKVFEGFGKIENIRFGNPATGRHNPFAFVTMHSVAEAVTVVESGKEEPYVLEGRPLQVHWSNLTNKYPPSRQLYFGNFNNGDLGKLREFLGPLAKLVDNAFFHQDKEHHGEWLPAGMIYCRTVEDATEILKACNGKPGPDGLPVLVRFARTRTQQRKERLERDDENKQEASGEQ